MSAETNGAMPATAFNENGPDGYYTTHYGYTKREEFARAAMQGVQLSLGVLGGSAPTNYEQVAHMAVMQADALLEELAKKDAMAANPTDDDFNQSPEDLAIWLDRKYARHGEDEDRQAAAMLRQYAALTAAQQQQGQAVAGLERFREPVISWGQANDYDRHGREAAIERRKPIVAELLRVIDTAPPPSVPEGWVLVPVEPTDEMVEAAWDSDAADYVGEHKRIHSLGLAWSAMLAAAPQPGKEVSRG